VLEGSGNGPRPANPCGFISRSQAASALGGPIVAETEAPLGPTCILRVRGRQPDVTIALEQSTLAAITSSMKGSHRTTVQGHVAVCGTLGRPMLFLSVSGGRVLNVTAPCDIAKALAAAALPHLTS
jgi:hypothetical protein